MNAERETLNAEPRGGSWLAATRRGARPAIWLIGICVGVSFHFFSLCAWANPTQEDVFKSISDNVDGTVDGRKVLAFLIAVVAVVIVLVLFNKREVRQTLPKALNHQGKLMRELIKTAGLKSGQARQLKAMAEQMEVAGERLKSPVTLMLCPSLMEPRIRNDE